MGGGSGVEWYFGYDFPNMDLNCEDWRSRDRMWDQTRYALEFFQKNLPFAEMAPDNDSATRAALVLAKPSEVYAVYLPNGGTTQLTLPDGTYSVSWYNPRTGGNLESGGTVSGPGARPIGPPPSEPREDWAVLLRRSD